MEDGEASGLRERKKIATREALCQAAIRLALSRGVENVRVPDIAAEAGVSPRTYNNYFSSVPEAVCALAADRARGLGDALRNRPPTEPLAEAIKNVMLVVEPGGGGGTDTSAAKDFVRMIMMTPALRGEFFKSVIVRENSLAEAIAVRVGSPPGELFPRLLASTYCGATRVVVHRWLNDDNADYRALLCEAFDLIAPMAATYDNRRRAA
ncbi:MAG TPA: TetR family transcriptional regulator [Streptosporangiaceae bacterium]